MPNPYPKRWIEEFDEELDSYAYPREYDYSEQIREQKAALAEETK